MKAAPRGPQEKRLLSAPLVGIAFPASGAAIERAATPRAPGRAEFGGDHRLTACARRGLGASGVCAPAGEFIR